jgi:RHS repeat-associated protein
VFSGGRGHPAAQYCANLGHPTDAETGLVYMRARYYEPWTGRFLSEDPALDGMNWFVYCANEPVGRSDSSGRAAAPAMPIAWVVAHALVGLVGLEAGAALAKIYFQEEVRLRMRAGLPEADAWQVAFDVYNQPLADKMRGALATAGGALIAIKAGLVASIPSLAVSFGIGFALGFAVGIYSALCMTLLAEETFEYYGS